MREVGTTDDLVDGLAPSLGRQRLGVGVAQGDDGVRALLGGLRGQGPVGQSRQSGKEQQRQPRVAPPPARKGRQCRRDQGEGADEVRPERGDARRHRAAEAVAEQVHRPAALPLQQPDDGAHMGAQPVAPVGRRRRPAEAGQVERPGVQVLTQQPHEVGPVGGGAPEPMHEQRGLTPALPRTLPDEHAALVRAGPRREHPLPVGQAGRRQPYVVRAHDRLHLSPTGRSRPVLTR